ncbi:MAG: SPFH domain-containing protein [Parcubacteria group bacterium]|nr:SPFH domain-containing protein [Parcubacteria group bacterium]
MQWAVLAGATPVVLGIACFLLVWFVLAPRNLFFTFVSEGTAKIVVKADQFSRCLIQWKGYTLDENGNVVSGKDGFHPFGGLRFVGIWPIWDIFVYLLRWNDVHRAEERNGRIEEVRFHAKWLDYILLRPDVYWTKLTGAETTPGTAETPEAQERIPLDVEFNITMQVINPYKVMFVAPPNWVENVLVRLDAVLRGFVATHTLDELLAMRGGGGEQAEIVTWNELGAHPFIQETLGEWGISIPENGIQMKNIGIPADIQQAAQARRTEQLRAEGERQRVQIGASAEAQRIHTTYGAVEQHASGMLIRTLEAVEKSPLPAALAVQVIPGLSDVLRGVLERPAAAVAAAPATDQDQPAAQ